MMMAHRRLTHHEPIRVDDDDAGDAHAHRRAASVMGKASSMVAMARAIALGVSCAVVVFYACGGGMMSFARRAGRMCVDGVGGVGVGGFSAPFVDKGAGKFAYGTASQDISRWDLRRVARYMSVDAAKTKKRMSRMRLKPKGSVKRVVATHHKTGTALMHDVFETIAKNSSFSFFDVRAAEDTPGAVADEAKFAAAFARADVLIDYHLGKPLPAYVTKDWRTRACESVISLLEREDKDYRLVHVVRDPADVLISGAVYHARRIRDEKWLNVPIPELKGQSYADFLKTSTPEQALLAEISFADDELRMLVLSYAECAADTRCLNVRFESLSANFTTTLARVLTHLEFSPRDIAAMVTVARVHDMNTWSTDELVSNEHYTKAENRSAYYAAARSNPFLNDTLVHLRRALRYSRDDAFIT